jgi:ribosome-binding factor A
MSYERAQRVAEAVRVEVSDIMAHALKDPRVGFASIVRVEVSSDLRYAKIYVSAMGDEKARADTFAGLESAKGFIRTEIGRRLRLRFVPEITFIEDSSIEYGSRIDKILRDLGHGEPSLPKDRDY